MSPPARIAVLAALAALICWRMPEVVEKGRFWAEEGKYFFANARTMPPLQALLTPFGGYLNIVASAGTLAARWLVPLADAPYVTIAISLGVQLVPPAILLGARDAWLAPPIVRVVACLLVILVPASEEIWLQTLHCQFQLALASVLIMALAVRRSARTGDLLVLFLAPLSGPGAFAVLPPLLLRAATACRADRGARIAHACALAAGMALQIGFFFNLGAGRNLAVQPLLFACIFTIRHLVVPFLGLERADRVATALRAAAEAGHVPAWALLLPACVFGALLAAALRRQSHVVLWLVCTGAGIAALSYYGALGGAAAMIDVRVGERYAFVPEAIFGLAVLALAATSRGATRLVATLATVWMLVVGFRDYRDTWPFVSHGPSWHGQIKRWTRDQAVPVRLWPEGWTLKLK